MLNRTKHTHMPRLSGAANSKSRTTYDNGQAASLGPVTVMNRPLQPGMIRSAGSPMLDADQLVGKARSNLSRQADIGSRKSLDQRPDFKRSPSILSS